VAGFDLEKYVSNSKRVDLAEFDFSTAREHALTPDEIRCLQYMMDVESSTIVYLRAVLRTSIIDDPENVAFLSCWAYEEYFHGRTIREFLKASGVDIEEDRYVKVKHNATVRERLEEFGAAALARIIPRHFHAAYLTWGAIQELTTLEGYGVLAARTSNPILKTVLARIIKDERRHFSFYYNKARQSLAADRAQWFTTFLLKKFWTPVGSGIKRDPDVDWMIHFVFGTPDGSTVADRIDSTMSRLPGLAWFKLLSETAARMA
jgi:rubrerythrin